MMVSGTLHVSQHHDDLENGHVPQVVMAMLKNVHLYYVNTSNTPEQQGDFWYWKLSYYGHDLMRVLVRASITGFAYTETFLEPDSETIPQIVLMQAINDEIHHHLLDPSYFPDWDTLLDKDSYLQENGIIIDRDVFDFGIYALMHAIGDGYYLASGNHTYPPRNRSFA